MTDFSHAFRRGVTISSHGRHRRERFRHDSSLAFRQWSVPALWVLLVSYVFTATTRFFYMRKTVATGEGHEPRLRRDLSNVTVTPKRDGHAVRSDQVAKSGVPDRADRLRPLGSSQSSCRPSAVRSRK